LTSTLSGSSTNDLATYSTKSFSIFTSPVG
jgi:hypothetical protein